MSAQIERCSECGAPTSEGTCGNCAPTGRPVDKGERRRSEAEAAREKARWDAHLVKRKVHERRAGEQRGPAPS